MDPALSTCGVVPILINASAPLLPAIIGGLLAFFSALLRPKVLWALASRQPLITLAILLGVGTAAMAGRLVLQTRRAPAPKTDWAQAARHILAADETPGTRLRPQWQFRREGEMVLAAPAVRDGQLYGATAMVDVAGTFGSVFCVDLNTGELVWQVETAGDRDLRAIYSSPVLTDNGRALIVGEGLHDDRDCALLCLDPATGALRWRVPTPFHIESTPAVHGDLVVAGAGAIERSGQASPTGDGFVFGVRISDGRELWRYPLVDVESSPVIAADGIVYVGSGIGGNAVVALRSEPDEALGGENRLRWKTAAPFPVTGPVTLHGDTIFAGAGRGNLVHGSSEPGGAVLALDRHTGALHWQTDFPDAVLAGVTVAEGVVLCPVRDGQVVALNESDGSVKWRQRISGDAPLLATPAVEGDRVLVVSSDGVLAVLALADGAILEKHLLNSATQPGRRRLSLSSPVVADGRVFVGSETGGLRAWDWLPQPVGL